MAVRDFVDAQGIGWRVWQTVPSGRTVLEPPFERGWLTFESNGRLRRLAPIPHGWESARASDLVRWCQLAVEFQRVTPAADHAAILQRMVETHRARTSGEHDREGRQRESASDGAP